MNGIDLMDGATWDAIQSKNLDKLWNMLLFGSASQTMAAYRKPRLATVNGVEVTDQPEFASDPLFVNKPNSTDWR